MARGEAGKDERETDKIIKGREPQSYETDDRETEKNVEAEKSTGRCGVGRDVWEEKKTGKDMGGKKQGVDGSEGESQERGSLGKD